MRNTSSSRKYRDSAWRNWALDKLHYGLWLNKVDDTVEAILDHYVTTLIYGFPQFADSLTALYAESNPLKTRLNAQHSKLLHSLQSLKVGLPDDQMISARSQLRQSLKGKTKLLSHLYDAGQYARRGKYEQSAAAAVEAEQMAIKLGYISDAS